MRSKGVISLALLGFLQLARADENIEQPDTGACAVCAVVPSHPIQRAQRDGELTR